MQITKVAALLASIIACSVMLTGCVIRIPLSVFRTPSIAIDRALFVCAEVREPIRTPLRIMIANESQATHVVLLTPSPPSMHPAYACGVAAVAPMHARPGAVVKLWFSAQDLDHVTTVAVCPLPTEAWPSGNVPMEPIGGHARMYEFEWAE